MSDWLDKYLKVNLTAKLTMIASVMMSWRCAEWFMTIRVEEHDVEPSAPLSSKNKDERKRRDYNDNEGSSSNAPTNTSSNSGESS